MAGAYTVVNGGTPAAVKTRPGTLHKLIVTAAVTGAITVHDNASAASGPVLYTSAANPAVGTVVDLEVRCNFGAFVTVGSAGQVLVSYT
jgi:hypothetical protein